MEVSVDLARIVGVLGIFMLGELGEDYDETLKRLQSGGVIELDIPEEVLALIPQKLMLRGKRSPTGQLTLQLQKEP